MCSKTPAWENPRQYSTTLGRYGSHSSQEAGNEWIHTRLLYSLAMQLLRRLWVSSDRYTALAFNLAALATSHRLTLSRYDSGVLCLVEKVLYR